MDSSQNYDIFSENSVREDHSLLSCNSEAYQNILTKIKNYLTLKNVAKDPEFINKFSTCLEDSNICISRCLTTITSILKDDNVSDDLNNVLKDAISLLQMLTIYLNNIVEIMILTSSDLKTFPITTGSIILTVFTHCKESEHLYGYHLNSVEINLKNLFQACHQLQKIYLKILEKYFIFDFMEKDQHEVLTKALVINLRICEVVHLLDVKTMAEQWKAFIAICEKYACRLLDEDIYNQCSEILCNIIEINLKSAIEKDEQDKMFLRSIKVASFHLKILLKACTVFQSGTTNNYNKVVHLLICIHRCERAVLEGKSGQFKSQINSLIVDTSHGLISQLLLDKRFVDSVVQFDMKTANEEEQLGYILLLISIIKYSIQMPAERPSFSNIIVNCVFNVIPYCDNWSHLVFKNKSDELSVLEDHVLAHAAALCATLDSEEFATLERRLYENILGVNVLLCMFTSRLWLLLAKIMGSTYTFSLLITLCKTYENLDKVDLFNDSLQKVFLSYVVNRLYENLPLDQKIKLKSQFEINERHYSLWSVLKIKNLPENICQSIQEGLIEELCINLNKLLKMDNYHEQDMQSMITTMKVLSTCFFIELNPNLEKNVMVLWSKACPKSLFPFPKDINCGVHWYYSLMEYLIPLTKQILEQLDLENVVMIFNIMMNIILTGNNELQLLLIPIFCKMSFYSNIAEKESSLDASEDEVFKYLLSETDPLIKRYTLSELVEYSKERKFKSILKIIGKSSEMKKLWQDVVKSDKHINDEKELTVSLADCNYAHKCVNTEIEMESESTMIRTKSSSNFDIDIDNLFEDVSEEPVRKKAKLNETETDLIIKRLEQDSILLQQIHDISDEDKKRIRVVYNRLRSRIV